MKEKTFSKEDILKLINLYREKEAIWNVSSKLYKRLDLKKKGWEYIAEQMNISVDLGKKKMKSLRSTFVAEKKKIERNKKLAAAGDIYEPNLFYFDEMTFLDESICFRKSSSNASSEPMKKNHLDENTNPNYEFDDNIQYNGEENFPLNTTISSLTSFQHNPLNDSSTKNRKHHNTDSTSSQSFSPKKIKITDEPIKILENDEALQNLFRFTDARENDECFIFGKCIATQLKKLPPLNLCQAMQEIQSVVSKHVERVLLENSSSSSIIHVTK